MGDAVVSRVRYRPPAVNLLQDISEDLSAHHSIGQRDLDQIQEVPELIRRPVSRYHTFKQRSAIIRTVPMQLRELDTIDAGIDSCSCVRFPGRL